MLFIWTKTQSANIRSNLLDQATKRYLNNRRWITMKDEMKSKIIFCFWLSYVVFLSSAWTNVSMRIMCFYLCVLLNDLYIFGWTRLFSCPVLGRMLALQSCAFIYVSDFYYTESFGKSTTTKNPQKLWFILESHWSTRIVKAIWTLTG